MFTKPSMARQEIESICSEAVKALGYLKLREQQLRVISFVQWRDAFGVLPTGYSKSLCYTLLPFVFDWLLGRNDSLMVVISPLIAKIDDQVGVFVFECLALLVSALIACNTTLGSKFR